MRIQEYVKISAILQRLLINMALTEASDNSICKISEILGGAVRSRRCEGCGEMRALLSFGREGRRVREQPTINWLAIRPRLRCR